MEWKTERNENGIKRNETLLIIRLGFKWILHMYIYTVYLLYFVEVDNAEQVGISVKCQNVVALADPELGCSVQIYPSPLN